MKSGRLYVVGVGPGDPELMTLKAVKILKKVPVFCFPKGKEEGSSVAMSIVSKIVSLDGKEVIEAHFPMKKVPVKDAASCDVSSSWEETVEIILSHVLKGKDIAFLTLGDSVIYSTFFYLYDRLLSLLPSLQVIIVPGVSAMSASSASAGMPLCLGSERIALLPATYEEEKLKDTLLSFDTVVLMKINKVFDRTLSLLEKLGLVSSAVVVEMASTEKERVIKDLRSIKGETLHYFTTLIVKK